MADTDPLVSNDSGAAVSAAPGATAPAPELDAPANNTDDLSPLLAEFDRTAKDPAESPSNGDAAPAQPQPPAWAPNPDDWLNLQVRAETNAALLEGELNRRRFDDLRRQEKEDFNRVLTLARDAIDDMPHLAEDHANRWLLSEYHTNTELQEAWDHRNDSQESAAYAERVVRRAIKRMRESARKIPTPADLEATADRALVTAAVMAGSGKAPPPESDADTRRRVARMSDHEFEDYKRSVTPGM